ncbi:hypothetical protein [Amorphus sp. 3PC139-8]|uniref:hypothetical protein n=1 Tax=Amorphus sp. 3PC139-8 TaxID=2735676 RepID=UPI00345D003A
MSQDLFEDRVRAKATRPAALPRLALSALAMLVATAPALADPYQRGNGGPGWNNPPGWSDPHRPDWNSPRWRHDVGDWAAAGVAGAAAGSIAAGALNDWAWRNAGPPPDESIDGPRLPDAASGDQGQPAEPAGCYTIGVQLYCPNQ